MENYYGFRTSDFPLCSRENAKLVKYKLENDTQLLICYSVLNIEILCTSSAWCLTEAGYPQSLKLPTAARGGRGFSHSGRRRSSIQSPIGEGSGRCPFPGIAGPAYLVLWNRARAHPRPVTHPCRWCRTQCLSLQVHGGEAGGEAVGEAMHP